MKTLKTLLLLAFVFLSKDAISQTISYQRDLVFYTKHYVFHSIKNEGLLKGKGVKDTLISSNSVPWDSLALHLPGKEKIDSAEVILGENIGGNKVYKYKIEQFELIIVEKNGSKTISNHGSKLAPEAVNELNNLMPGDKLIFRGIIVYKKGKKVSQLLGVFIVYIQ
jgi:hypothetical protein